MVICNYKACLCSLIVLFLTRVPFLQNIIDYFMENTCVYTSFSHDFIEQTNEEGERVSFTIFYNKRGLNPTKRLP